MWELTKRTSLRISSVLSIVEPEPDLCTGSGSDQKVLGPTGSGSATLLCSVHPRRLTPWGHFNRRLSSHFKLFLKEIDSLGGGLYFLGSEIDSTVDHSPRHVFRFSPLCRIENILTRCS